jgi:hypothetical protein
MIRLPHVAITVGIALTASACSFSVGGPDYAKLEASISDEVNTAFASFDTATTAVDCPEQDNLDVGAQFICTVQLTDLDGDMRVNVEVVNDDLDVEFNTIDLLYDMRQVETAIADDQTSQIGIEIAVDCGDDRLQAIEGGASFECTATDPDGFTATVDVATDTEGNITWTVTPDEV